jgi:hypothetical protein
MKKAICFFFVMLLHCPVKLLADDVQMYGVDDKDKGKGKGHAYIIDGYKKYYDNYDMIHVNMGQWNVPNGYYMEHLLNPQFLTTAPKKYNHEFHFFCIHP